MCSILLLVEPKDSHHKKTSAVETGDVCGRAVACRQHVRSHRPVNPLPLAVFPVPEIPDASSFPRTEEPLPRSRRSCY